MDELIAAVARAVNLSTDRSALAVAAVLRFFTARLPSPLVGELHARLQTCGTGTQAKPPGTGPRPAH